MSRFNTPAALEDAARMAKPFARRALLEKVGWVPHPGQRRILRSTARHRVCSCGRRAGKTEVGGYELGTEVLITDLLLGEIPFGKRREFWCVGGGYSDAAKEFRVLWNVAQTLGVKLDRGSINNEPAGEMRLSLFGGKFLVIAKSAQYPERLVGEGLAGVLLCEAAKMGERIWTRFLRPTLADLRGWSLHTSTPEGRNHFYGLWNLGQNADETEWASWRMPAWVNPHVYPGGADDREIVALRRDLTPEAFKQEVAAEFTTFVGRVFKEFDEETHVRDFSWNPDWPTYAAVDYGYVNPAVWLVVQINPYDQSVWVVDELYESGLIIDDFAREIQFRGLLPPGLRTFYPDPSGPADSRALEHHLRISSARGTGGPLSDRLRMIREALKVRNQHLPEGHELRTPRLFINRKCTNTIREFSSYRYPERRSESTTGNAENPLKRDDHCPEALGRFFAAYFETPEGGSVRTVRANFGR